MKRVFVTTFLLIMLILHTRSQSVNLLPAIKEPIKNGIITYNDGGAYYFNDLRVTGDSVWFYDLNQQKYLIPLKDIAKITRKGNSAGTGLLAGTAAGLLTGVILGKALDDFADGLLFLFTWGSEDDADTGDFQAQTVLSMGLIGAVSGTLWGLLIPRQKVVYLNQQTTLSFNPAVFQVQGNPGAGLTLRINFR